MKYVWVTITYMFLALLLSGLGGCVGNGALLQDIECAGKISVVGSGSGFAGLNGAVDCGDGFKLNTGTRGSQSVVKP